MNDLLLDKLRPYELPGGVSRPLPRALRDRLVSSVAAVLHDRRRLHDHIRDLQVHFGRSFPPYRLLTPQQLRDVLRDGVSALDDATLAHIYHDPVSLYDLYEQVAAQTGQPGPIDGPGPDD